MNRSIRQGRKSPVRFVAEGINRRDRSRSKGRRFKSPDRINKKLNTSNSPNEERGRPKSPGRNAKSPAKSPSRRKIVEDKEVKKKSSPVRSKESSVNRIEEFIRSSLTPELQQVNDVIRRSVSKFEETIAEATSTLKRRTAKLNHQTILGDGQMTNNATQMENTDVETTAASLVNNNNKNHGHYREFGGLFGALILMVLMPSVVIISQLICTQENCPLFPKTIVLSSKRFFDLNASMWYIGYLITQCLFSVIPLGPKIYGAGSKGSELIYRRNGLGCIILTLSCLAYIIYFLDFQLIQLLDKTLPLLITSLLCALLFTVVLHNLSFDESYRNPFDNSENTMFNMWIGRYINPKLGPIDVKITLIRSSLCLIVVYNGLLMLKEIQTKSYSSDYSINLMVICTLQALLALDPLIFESSLISSFTITQEGCGLYLMMALAIIPFWITLIPKYIYSLKPEYNLWAIVLMISLHMIGHTIYRVSCSQNDVFQRNPHSVKSSDILYSRHPEKIFRGGLRHRIRYPEYSGLLLIIIGWCTGCLIMLPLHWLPISMLFVTFAAIMMHSKRMDNRSNIKHNLNWTSYVSTSSAIIPFVY